MRAVRVFMFLTALAIPSPAAAQRIEGRVLDVITREPVEAATLRLMRNGDQIASAVSDDDGRFFLRAPEFGRYELLGTRVGFADARSPIDLNADGIFTVELAMGVEPLNVVPIEVTVPRSRYLETRGFYERMKAGTGDYRTGDQLRRRNLQTLVDVLRGMRGVRIQRVNWKHEVYITGANSCLPQIVVDGVTVRYGGKTVQAGGALSLEDLVNVSHIEGIEVYRGSSVPVEFEGPNAACGVIVVWTRLR